MIKIRAKGGLKGKSCSSIVVLNHINNYGHNVMGCG